MKERKIIISRNVVFDESVFPYEKRSENSEKPPDNLLLTDLFNAHRTNHIEEGTANNNVLPNNEQE